MAEWYKLQIFLWAHKCGYFSYNASELHQETLTTIEKKKVMTAPPMNPYQVFLGESSINLVFPKKQPTRYAKISLQMTIRVGRMNQHRPSKVLFRIALPGPNISKTLRQFHANSLNWYFMNPCLKESTKRVSIAISPLTEMKLWQTSRRSSHWCCKTSSGSLFTISLPRMQQDPSPNIIQFKIGVNGMRFSLSSLLLMLFTSLYIPNTSPQISSPTQKCPIEIMRMYPRSMYMVVVTLVKKFLLSLLPWWVWSTGTFFFYFSTSENSLEVADSSGIFEVCLDMYSK